MSVQTAEVEGKKVELSNLDKVLFAAAGLTKADLIDYCERVAPVMLPHLAGRPLSFERYPDGVEAEGFMQKNASDYFPSWIRRARLTKQDGAVEHVVAEDAATLVYLANQACVTLHVGLARTDRIDHPDRMVIDLDPSDDDFAKVRRAAREARALIERSASCRSFRLPGREACTSGCRSTARPTSIRCAHSPRRSPRRWLRAARAR
jgi:bifunctional non-homologous end joining protein LigD